MTELEISALIKGLSDRHSIPFNEGGILAIPGATETNPVSGLIDQSMQKTCDAIARGISQALGGGTGPVSWSNPIILPYTAFQAGALSNTITLYTQPARGTLHGVLVVPTARFLGAGQVTVATGHAGQADAFTPPFDVSVDPADTYFQGPIHVMDMRSLANPTALTITAYGDSNLSNLTAGSLAISLLLGRI